MDKITENSQDKLIRVLSSKNDSYLGPRKLSHQVNHSVDFTDLIQRNIISKSIQFEDINQLPQKGKMQQVLSHKMNSQTSFMKNQLKRVLTQERAN